MHVCCGDNLEGLIDFFGHLLDQTADVHSAENSKQEVSDAILKKAHPLYDSVLSENRRLAAENKRLRTQRQALCHQYRKILAGDMAVMEEWKDLQKELRKRNQYGEVKRV
jgi:uncharacterized protein (DUF3084 family)